MQFKYKRVNIWPSGSFGCHRCLQQLHASFILSNLRVFVCWVWVCVHPWVFFPISGPIFPSRGRPLCRLEMWFQWSLTPITFASSLASPVIPLRISNLFTQAESCAYSTWPPHSSLAIVWGGYYHINAALRPRGSYKKRKLGWHLSPAPPSSLFRSFPHCHSLFVFFFFFFPCSLASAMFSDISSGRLPLIPFLHTFWFDVCKRLASFPLLN